MSKIHISKEKFYGYTLCGVRSDKKVYYSRPDGATCLRCIKIRDNIEHNKKVKNLLNFFSVKIKGG